MSNFTRSLIAFTLSRRCSRNWLLTVIEWVRLECEHDSASVTADVLEGDCPQVAVQRCRACGSVRRCPDGMWRP